MGVLSSLPTLDVSADPSGHALLVDDLHGAVASEERDWQGPIQSDYRSLLSLEHNLSVRIGVGSLNRLSGADPMAQKSTVVVLRALGAFPEQMSRRDTLPFFIHPSWHMVELAEPLVVCMRISQLFATRTAGIMPFIWNTIRAEQLRLAEDRSLGVHDLFAASQAQLVYLMMRATVGTAEPAGYNQEMLVLANVICMRWIHASREDFCYDESTVPSASSDAWIYAESRRRTACAWFLMSQVLSLETGQRCDAMDTFLALPLPSSKTQWTSSTLQPAESRSDTLKPSIYTIGNLLQTHKKSADAVVARQLACWKADTDELGMLLNLTVAML